MHVMLDVAVNCPICGDETTVACDSEGYEAWLNGALIQNALPTLTSSERERLITGICTPCWNNSFGED